MLHKIELNFPELGHAQIQLFLNFWQANMMNLRSFVTGFFGKQPAIFRSSYSPQESAERLSERVEKSMFAVRAQRHLTGRVKPNSVSVRCVTPPMHNSFAPIFSGEFHVHNGATILQGDFAPLLGVRIFMAFWFGALLLSSVAGIITAILGAFLARSITFPLWQAGLSMALAPLPVAFGGFLLVSLGLCLAREDISFIEQTIRGSLEN